MSNKIDLKKLDWIDRTHYVALVFDYWEKFPRLSCMLDSDFGAGILDAIDCRFKKTPNGIGICAHKSNPGGISVDAIMTEYRLIRTGMKKVDANIRAAAIEVVGSVISNTPATHPSEDLLNPSDWDKYLSGVDAASALEDVCAIMKDRAKQYDSPKGERSMDKVVEAFNIITGHQLSTSDGYMLMSLLKLVRSQNSSRPDALVDSVKDNIAYGALYAETLVNERKEESK